MIAGPWKEEDEDSVDQGLRLQGLVMSDEKLGPLAVGTWQGGLETPSSGVSNA